MNLRWIFFGLTVLGTPAVASAGPGAGRPRGTVTSTAAAARTSTVAATAIDRELAQYLVLLESWDEIKELELLELLPLLEAEDD